MAIMQQIDDPKTFRPLPQQRPKGSGAGRSSKTWPWLFKVVADAVVLRTKGTMDAWVVDRRIPIDELEFTIQMEVLLPGVWKYLKERRPNQKTSHARLLLNRVYKMYYEGTSARGSGHDPSTRAVAEGSEHWHRALPPSNPLWRLHSQISRHQISTVDDWSRYL